MLYCCFEWKISFFLLTHVIESIIIFCLSLEKSCEAWYTQEYYRGLWLFWSFRIWEIFRLASDDWEEEESFSTNWNLRCWENWVNGEEKFSLVEEKRFLSKQQHKQSLHMLWVCFAYRRLCVKIFSGGLQLSGGCFRKINWGYTGCDGLVWAAQRRRVVWVFEI